ncbi:MAG: LPS export ABC transporter periplasmic protein LptC [Flavobacteriales bacterium]|nr:LPS export ABC transporter periplasmic protein LptC [Flavobacteriales bacterium]|tara:strand:- start:1449 stop:1994 length:546 start_codon:yes stop_codon:yes gene_type:complete
MRMMPSIFLVGILLSCVNDPKEVEELNDEERYPDQEMRGVDVLYSTMGEVQFRLKAPLVHQYGGEESYNEMPEGVDIEIYDDTTMVVSSRLTANYAIDIAHEKRMEAKDNVVVINDEGDTLNTEHLIWDLEKDEIRSDVFVKITTPQQVLMGEGLISNQDFTDYRILKPRGIINLKDAQSN